MTFRQRILLPVLFNQTLPACSADQAGQRCSKYSMLMSTESKFPVLLPKLTRVTFSIQDLLEPRDGRLGHSHKIERPDSNTVCGHAESPNVVRKADESAACEETPM
ncbi:hypothetical protein QBC38DRAFT_282340 [Podospora fimiseda]|uniref:Secreted protein n=1 Tax=Podospora fimiseda TaxID=252190 RepID=A0AAN7BK91_9PEZI|nr:hypothetical protein QBC38DRAFT_282340 [Podospora fimiseda]